MSFTCAPPGFWRGRLAPPAPIRRPPSRGNSRVSTCVRSAGPVPQPSRSGPAGRPTRVRVANAAARNRLGREAQADNEFRTEQRPDLGRVVSVRISFASSRSGVRFSLAPLQVRDPLRSPAERCARETAIYNQSWKQACVAAHPGTTISDAPEPTPPYICHDPGTPTTTTSMPSVTAPTIPTASATTSGAGPQPFVHAPTDIPSPTPGQEPIVPVPSAGQSGSARPSSTPPVIRVPSSGGRYSMAGFKPTRPVCHPIDRAARRQKCARSQIRYRGLY